MEKMEELKNLLTANVNKVTELLHKKEKEEIMEEKKKSKAGLIFAIIGIVVVVAAAAYGLYRFFAPDYLEDFEDDFDDDFEDDLGLDSLNMTSLYISLGNDKMTIQDLYNYSTVKDLANMMNTEIVNKRENRKENIEVKNISSKFNMNTVLLTGVTGFVGVNLLRELVESKDTEKIYCIVRTKVGLSSYERFENTIK